MIDFTTLQSTLRSLDHHFKVEAGKSVNRLLTMRNWPSSGLAETGGVGSRFWKTLPRNTEFFPSTSALYLNFV
ncbi:MAG: hypothetical protein IPM82_26315 [Saprospiraceae bacterium]|nr:hypothetical protein [Saprospiraceae bacterium]